MAAIKSKGKSHMGEASRRLLTLLHQYGEVKDKSGRVTTVLAEQTGLPSTKFSSALGFLSDKGLIVKTTKGKRTYSVKLTPEGQKRAANPYYGLQAEDALLRWLEKEPTHRYESTPGELGFDLAIVVDDGDGGWNPASFISAIKRLEEQGKITVKRKTPNGYPYGVELFRPEVTLDEGDYVVSHEDAVKSGEALLEAGPAEPQGSQGPLEGADSDFPESELPSDPVDYDALAGALLRQVMEQAANPPVIVQTDEGTVASLRASLERMQANVERGAKALHLLTMEHEELREEYNRVVVERNEAMMRVQKLSEKKASHRAPGGGKVGENLTPESRANLERLMKSLPAGPGR
jgi:DNA-binding MarR family transcriptional regulator/FtsZ-binding cell division protein ZapB